MQVRKLIFNAGNYLNHKISVKFLACLGVFWLIALAALRSNAASTDFVESDDHTTKLKLMASYYEATPPALIIAFHFKLSDGWKLYAPDAGNFSQPPSFNFEGSSNLDWSEAEIIWPKAIAEQEQLGEETISYSVYRNEALIAVKLKVPTPEKPISLKVLVNYNLCKDICVPAEQELFLNIPLLQADSKVLNLISHSLPGSLATPTALKETTGHLVKLSASGPTNDNIKEGESYKALIEALFLAFIGGLVLNIMPCILPVLSIKLLSIINHHNASLIKIRLAYMATALGIILSFLSLALLTILLKMLGNSVGWGLQFQNPYFLIFLIIILMTFVANLLGLFEINFNTLLNFLSNKKLFKENNQNHVFIANFLSGVLVVLLSTPCSAPFLGTAISFALAQNGPLILLTFLFMALGLAFPYFCLTIFPGAIKLLPKPGKWMLRVKQLMAGFLTATAIWLIYVLSHNIGFTAGIVAAAFASLIIGFFALQNRLGGSMKLKALILALIIALMFILPTRINVYNTIKAAELDAYWQEFEPELITALVKQNKTVVVDITADWCLTCRLNKSLVLNSKEVVAKLKEPNIIAMRGDLTRPHPYIINFMRKHNRYAIPFNVIYGPGAPNGLLASELLSKEKFIELILIASQK